MLFLYFLMLLHSYLPYTFCYLYALGGVGTAPQFRFSIPWLDLGLVDRLRHLVECGNLAQASLPGPGCCIITAGQWPGGSGNPIHSCHILLEKTRVQEGHSLLKSPRQSIRGAQDTLEGSASPLPLPSVAPHSLSHAVNLKSQKEKGSVPGCGPVALPKARAYCQSDPFPWKQPAGAACSCQPEVWWSLSP